jgi:hypothetical protein
MSGIACSIIVSGTGLSALTPEAQIDIRSTGKAARVATAIAGCAVLRRFGDYSCQFARSGHARFCLKWVSERLQ